MTAWDRCVAWVEVPNANRDLRISNSPKTGISLTLIERRASGLIRHAFGYGQTREEAAQDAIEQARLAEVFPTLTLELLAGGAS